MREIQRDRGTMPKGESEAAIAEVEEYLKGYGFYQKLLRLSRFEKKYFQSEEDADELCEPPLARARMFAIRHFVMGLPNGDEKLLLYYHYVRGDSIERCAQLLGIARSSCFRLKKRALRMAAEYRKEKIFQENGVEE